MNQQLSYEIAGVMPQAIATGLFVSLCTIQLPDGNIGASGAPSGTYANVSGLVAIACMDAPQPPSEIKLGAEQFKAGTQVTELTKRHILLDDFYPTIEANWRLGARAVVTSDTGLYPETYDICAVESDSQRTQTRLELKLYSAGAVQA